MKYLVFDATNFLFRTLYGHIKEDEDVVAGLALHVTLVTLNKYYRDLKPHKIIMCFDRPNWRKQYTLSEQCSFEHIYKEHRQKGLTPADKKKLEQFYAHMREFEHLLKTHTSVITMAEEGLEADDLVAGVVQILSNEEDVEITIVSTDKDFIQLLKFPNTYILNPDTGKLRTLEKWDGDAEYFLFEKCIRGDLQSDNIPSAYPRVRSDRLKKAFKDPFEHESLMNETWTSPTGKEYKVKDRFKENKMLIDLTKQPKEIRMKIFKTVEESLDSPGKFSWFHFLRFLGKFELEELTKNASQYTEMLSR